MKGLRLREVNPHETRLLIRFRAINMGLGWMRLLLSLMVIDYHYSFFDREVEPLIRQAFPVLSGSGNLPGGALAVLGFFVLSGYVIALVLNRKYGVVRNGVAAFYCGRVLRIYPLYWLVLFLAILESAYFQKTTVLLGPSLTFHTFIDMIFLFPVGLYTLFVSHGAKPTYLNLFFYKGIGQIWTISFDLIFYALSPFLLQSRRQTFLATGLGALYVLGVGVFVPRSSGLVFWEDHIYTNGLLLFVAFLVGGLVFHGVFSVGRPVAGGLGAFALLCLPFFPLFGKNALLSSLVAILAFAFLIDFLSGHRGRRDEFFGELTYAAYLVHLPVLFWLRHSFHGGVEGVGLAVTYLVTILLVLFFERPLDRFRSRYCGCLSLSSPGVDRLLSRLDTASRNQSVSMTLLLILGLLYAGSLWALGSIP